MEAGGSPGHPQGSRQLVLDSDRRLPLLHLVVRKSNIVSRFARDQPGGAAYGEAQAGGGAPGD